MKNYKKLILISELIVALTPISFFHNNIYTWHDARGNTLFSQTAPFFAEEFEEVNVRNTSKDYSDSSPILD